MMRDVRQAGDLRGKYVLVRTSFDVPIKDGKVQNTFRIAKALPTITFLREQGARVLLLTHIGRDPKNTTLPLIDSLLELGVSAKHVPAVIGPTVEEAIAQMDDGAVVLLENLRVHAEEEANDETFAKTLASYADIYVNDAFAVSHRAHASIVGIPKYIPGYAGITFMEEYSELNKALEPEHPSLFILGGAKFETKAPLIEQYSHEYTNTFIGGAIANDFLKGKGCEVGSSLVSPVDLHGNPLLVQKNVLLPVDMIAVGDDGAHPAVCSTMQHDEKILDVGPETIKMLAPYIERAKTILWNGPLGNYEAGYDAATKACAELVAKSSAYSIVGGGDTVAAIESLGIQEAFGFLSTAGGAMLEFLEKRTLPGIEALEKTGSYGI